MAMRPNYRQQRNDRTRAKDAKKEKKLAKQQERVALRKAGAGGPAAAMDAPALPSGTEAPAAAVPTAEKAG